MIITGITEISKTKVKVCVDNTETFALYKGELIKYQIKEGKEISNEIYEDIVNVVLTKRAKIRIMNLLKSRDYTEYQLRNKLKQAYYSDTIICEVMSYVKSFGYVDDIKYSKSYIECCENSKSKKRIENDLIRKGVSKNNIEQAYRQHIEDGSAIREEELIQKLLIKRNFNRHEATYEERCKIINFLYRKGFSLDKIYKIVGQPFDEE